ncbi:MAG TPA: DEAD/DEAH box helicase [Steroidobacter sp.]|jgi:ATP-dependent Lhr-like helicase|nr:DEAD/DEAH box helicase [Steroidobacter sp.]
MDIRDLFHPAVAAWFSKTFSAPTRAQSDAWPAIQSTRDVLIAAPTGSGKTLAAFLAAIDELVREGERHPLPDETRIVYVSPLKALSNDVNRNLEAPLAGIREELRNHGMPGIEIRTWVRTGDTPQYERTQMRRKAPHIVVTTPESLYILLGSQSGRAMLSTTRTVIVDEIHAVAGSKRGAHLAISLERLEALTSRRLTRVGLSATQKPLEEAARLLVGCKRIGVDGALDCTIVDSGHVLRRDLGVELPDAPLEAVMSNEVWTQVYDRLAQLIREHRTTLVFVNTRRLAERVCRRLSERLERKPAQNGQTMADAESSAGFCADDASGFEEAACTPGEMMGSPSYKSPSADHERRSAVAAHHGSLAKELRFDAEQRLKRGELKALVATASLELGIDVGEVDLVCQISSPRSINAFLQRVGRSGHAVGGKPKGRLFPLSRDDLVECAALLDSVRRGELDRLKIPTASVDVVAQQIVAEVAAREWPENELYELLRGAYPCRDLKRESFDDIVRMLAEGFATRRGRRGALLYHDGVNQTLRGRKGARLTAITSGGAIPDAADYQVVLEPEGVIVGTVNEDFAVESLAGDVFQLGNHSYRIIRVERSAVRVEDARGEAPSIPFWLGEAPGRTDELSFAVSRLRAELATRLGALQAGRASGMQEEGVGSGCAAPAARNPDAADFPWLTQELGLSHAAASQLIAYLASARAALGGLPTQQTVVFERFFDEAGGMQLLVHSPFGRRINRAWGLALRKRFCRTFNFELQAAATEDSIVLSLTTAHSFELIDVAKYLHPNAAREILIQALLAAPMFTTRWRWNASIALALPRFRGGRKVPPALARMNAEDLLAAVFPDQVACGENVVGDIVVPDHPLVRQTVRDCLEEAMDFDGFARVLTGVLSGAISVVARDLTEPSPLALEALSARPYAYLDDAPLEERRTQAVIARRFIDPTSAADIGKLDPDAIARVREEAWPEASSADELHDALYWLTFLMEEEVERAPTWPALVEELLKQRRVTRLRPHAMADARVDYQCVGNAQDAHSALLEAAPARERPAILIPAERLPLFCAAFDDASADPLLTVPPAHDRRWSREDALREIVRGRLEGLGPTSASAIARSFGARVEDIDTALLALEAEGSAMRGQFTNEPDGGHAPQWCSRRLLARIHRCTVKRLRAEIEPVRARDFLRFLFDWQRVTPVARMQGPDSIAAILAQLEGFDAPASAWETEVLPMRIAEYEPAWLDEQCLAGRIVWTRLAPRTADSERGAAPVRSTPIALLARKHAHFWSLSTEPSRTQLTSKAQQVAELLRTHGASFFDEIVENAGLLANQVEEALAELVALGMVNSDSFGGLRALLLPSNRKRPTARDSRRRRRIAIFGMQDAGRWTLVRRGGSSMRSAGWAENSSAGSSLQSSALNRASEAEALEHICRTLLRRWGVVFWKLLQREADWLPAWRDLLMCLRRLEARGEIRGGRFVAGFSGEQFALPEAIGSLREARRKPHSGELLSLSGADPLNLIGVLTPGVRLPSLTSNRVLYRDGLPIALLAGGEVRFVESLDEKEQWQARTALLRRRVPAMLADLV